MPDGPNIHRSNPRANYESSRPNSAQRGYDWRWRRARKIWLFKHPLCVECEKQGLSVRATDVDHIVPHRGNQVLFWRQDNWQSLCATHHSEKTAGGD